MAQGRPGLVFRGAHVDKICVQWVRAMVRQILEHVGERTTAPAIAPARSPPLALNGQQLESLDAVFEAIPDLEFDQTANLVAEAVHDLWMHLAGADAEPIPELEFDQTLGL